MIPLIILLNNNDLKNYKKALFLFISMISVSISSFVLYVPIILLLIIYYHKTIYSSLPKFNIWVYVFVIFTFIIYLFQAIELYYSIKVNPFSSRLNNYFNLDNFVVENNFFINSITRLKDYLLSNSFILSFLLLCLIASYNSKYLNKLLKNIFIIIILYFFLSAFISIFNFDYLKNYRLDIILNTIGIIILLNLPESLEHVRFSKRNKTIIILISIMILYLF